MEEKGHGCRDPENRAALSSGKDDVKATAALHHTVEEEIVARAVGGGGGVGNAVCAGLWPPCTMMEACRVCWRFSWALEAVQALHQQQSAGKGDLWTVQPFQPCPLRASGLCE